MLLCVVLGQMVPSMGRFAPAQGEDVSQCAPGSKTSSMGTNGTAAAAMPSCSSGGGAINVRTASEEMEAELQSSKAMLQREKEENTKLMHAMKRLNESSKSGASSGLSDSPEENEVALLRESILQKQAIVNKLHAKSVELDAK